MTAPLTAVVHTLVTARAALADATPSPDPTGGGLRPGLEETDITPGLVGFLVTFVLAVACVFLFLSLSRHLRTTRRNAEAQGLEIEPRKGIGIQRDTPRAADDGDGAGPATGDAGTDPGRKDGPA